MNLGDLGKALVHWFGFQEHIGRSFMMNEDALKYPVADYLVNQGGLGIGVIKLEYTHTKFSSRRVDLVIETGENEISYGYEFKLATENTRYEAEKQRIFNDLMRLFYLSQVASKKCYFIILGKNPNFTRDFQNCTHKAQSSANNQPSFYEEWFSFIQGGSKEVNLLLTRGDEYSEIYQKFLDDYSKNSTNGVNVILPGSITTTCEFVEAYQHPYRVGIWSVS